MQTDIDIDIMHNVAILVKVKEWVCFQECFGPPRPYIESECVKV